MTKEQLREADEELLDQLQAELSVAATVEERRRLRSDIERVSKRMGRVEVEAA